VMEAPQRSGTLISAQNALNFNREVFVVPNHPLMIHALGGLELLDQGAHLALSAQQIKKDLNLNWIDPILSLLDRPHSTEEICSKLQQSIPIILAHLSELEQEKLIENIGLFCQLC